MPQGTSSSSCPTSMICAPSRDSLATCQVYWANENPMFPAGGKMTQHLARLKVGQPVARGEGRSAHVAVSCLVAVGIYNGLPNAEMQQRSPALLASASAPGLWQQSMPGNGELEGP